MRTTTGHHGHNFRLHAVVDEAGTGAQAVAHSAAAGAEFDPPQPSHAAHARRPAGPPPLPQPLLATPGMISLGGGMPNPKLFPFTGMSFTLADGTQLQLDDAAVAAALQYSNTPCVAAGAQGSAWPCKL